MLFDDLHVLSGHTPESLKGWWMRCQGRSSRIVRQVIRRTALQLIGNGADMRTSCHGRRR